MAEVVGAGSDQGATPAASAGSAQSEPNRWAVLALLSVAQLMVVLDATIVTIAIPSAQQALHFSTDSRQWIVTAYALAFGSLLLLGGKLGDLFGRKWTLIIGLVGFSVASAIGGLAQSFGVLVTARTLQGAFGALLAPSALGLLTVTFEGSPDRPTAFGIFGAIAGGGASLGLILGGALTQLLSWRWCLYVNLVIAVPTTIVALRLLVNSRAPNREPIDIPGVLTSALGLFALVYGFSNAETHSWGATATVVALIASPVLLTAFVLIERRAEHPLLPLHIIWDRARGGSYSALFLAGAGIFAVFLFLTYFLQQQLGLSPITTGLAFLPLTGVLVVTSTTVQTRVISRTGVKPLVLAGMALGALGMFLFTRLTPSSGYAGNVLPGLLVLGVALGCIFAPAFSTATLGVEGREAGVASAMVNTAQQIGGSVGTALLSTIFASAVSSYAAGHLHTADLANAAAVHGYTTAFWWSVGIFAVGFFVALLVFPGRARPRVPTLRAALARFAIGNCHHFEAKDGGRDAVGATTGAGGR
ncbi:MAG TPA: MFS transporter [Solirubrobacteraceae bacterium]|jgi:EmrB/QacA subfamily drug resistance transporter|nr:MFS transporter [Solirubrobacteraceae bacterium]